LALEFMVYQRVFQACGRGDEIDDLLTVFAAKCIKPVVTGDGGTVSMPGVRERPV